MTLATVGKCMKSLGKSLSMDSTILLSSGYKMPFFGIGTSLLNDEAVLETTLRTAINAGYRKIDTAFSYGNHKLIGRILKKIFDEGKVKREDIFIIDKLPNNGMTDPERFLSRSLIDLKIDYVDLYLVHSPIATQWTPNDIEKVFPCENGDLLTEHVNLMQTWKGMEETVNMGMAMSIGLSNFNSKQIYHIHDEAMTKPANIQVECHPYLPQNELHAFCDELDISLTAYCPIGNPNFLKFAHAMGLDYPEAPVLLKEEKLKIIAEKHKKTPAQIALRYLVQRGIAIIPKSTNPERIKANSEIFDFTLDDQDQELIASLNNGYRFVKLDFWKSMKEHPEHPFNIPF